MFLYVIVMLGKFNMVEHRVWLSLAGLTGIILGSVFGVGFCSIFGLVFTDLHNVLPFLMLGVGIDDMFVLVKGYDNLSEDEKNLPLPERFAKTLSVSGMAVSVSSVTNIVAFSIGATTVIPALRSFCLYCSVGIMAIFIYTLTFFTACMVIDQRRIDERRDGCLCCYKHGDSWSPNNATNIEQPNFLFTKFVKFSTYRLTKFFVIMLTLGFFCVACYGISRLEQRNGSAERMLIPDDSYLAKWFDDRMKYFNDKGERGTIYVADFAMNSEQLDRVSWLVKSLANQTDIISEVDNWALGFSRFYDRSMNSSVIKTELGKYLHSPQGLRFRDRFEFSRDRMPECNEETPEVLMFKIEYQHPLFSGPMEHVPALNRVKQIIKDANITGRVFTKSNEFWEVDEIFSDELIRSISLALVCVFLIVIFMLANVTGAVLVLISVMFTIADVMGFMYFWEVTIDSTAGMLLILCVGLSVDYSAHIAHGFLHQKEDTNIISREDRLNDRTQRTLLQIGPAVFYGGLSTLLAIVLLGASDYYPFVVFFKVFLLVVLFGLFHGLVFLPVLLSLVGPRHPDDQHHQHTDDNIIKSELEKLQSTTSDNLDL